MIRSWRYTLKLWAACWLGTPLRLPPGRYHVHGSNPRLRRIVVGLSGQLRGVVGPCDEFS